jgi:hypothetical protein
VRLAAISVVATAGLLVVADVGTKAAARGTPNPCRSYSRVIAANERVRVVARGDEFWACGKARPRGYLMGVRGYGLTAAADLTHVRVAGRFVAWAEYSQERENVDYYVWILDAVRGGSHAYATGSPPPALLSAGIGPATALIVEPRGALAWIAKNKSASPPSYEVHTVSAGRRSLVAAGPGIEPGSLASSGTTLYWTQDGAAHSARF